MIFFPLLCSMLAFISQPEMSSGFIPKAPTYGKTVMVVSANAHATQAGLEILESGGNALDAAIAMQMVLNVVEPQSSGIGGGAFLLYYSSRDKKVSCFDGRETAPSKANDKLFLNAQGKPKTFDQVVAGGRSVGVPGVLSMLEMAHQKEGHLPWDALFDRGISLAENGYPISHRLYELIKKTPHLDIFQSTREYFFEEGKPKKEHTILKNPELAQTFREIKEKGADAFYYGPIAQDIVRAVQKAEKNPGLLSVDDLAAYRPLMREPIKINWKDHEIYGFPPPSSGGIVVSQILKMLSYKDLIGLSFGSAPFINLFCSASMLSFADRNYYIGDPDFTFVPVDRLLNDSYLKERSSQISPEKALKKAIPGLFAVGCCPGFFISPPLELSSTSHLCVVDKEGNAVSMTTSVENAFGSLLFVRGFFLNNQLTDFSFVSKKNGRKAANRIEPGKRPMSSMSPTFVFKDGNLVLALGSAGGARIINYVAQSALGVLQFGMNIQDAISFPHYTATSETIDLEKETFLENEAPLLRHIGNTVEIMPLTSGTSGIQVEGQDLIGGVDPRREGLALGN